MIFSKAYRDALFGAFCSLACSSASLSAQGLPGSGGLEITTLFRRGEGGVTGIYREPILLTAGKGVVLAIATGKGGTGWSDREPNNLVVKRSADHGRTWGPPQIILDRSTGDSGISFNPLAAVYDARKGRVILLIHEFQTRRNVQIQSDDEGLTWSKVRDITAQFKGPGLLLPAGSTSYVAIGPGSGVQLRKGPYAGRLAVPGGVFPDNIPRVFYSDDHGESWHYSDPPAAGGLTAQHENDLVELPDGVLLRAARLDARGRGISLSRDGGKTWTSHLSGPGLDVPSCYAALAQFTDTADGFRRNRLLFSSPIAAKEGRPYDRYNGNVFLSYDNGKSWPVKREVYAPLFGYSDVAALADGGIGVLFEGDDSAHTVWTPQNNSWVYSNRILFARMTLEWLTGGADTRENPTGAFPGRDLSLAPRHVRFLGRKLRLDLPPGHKDARILVAHPSGRTLLSASAPEGEIRLDLSRLAPGLYTASVWDDGRLLMRCLFRK